MDAPKQNWTWYEQKCRAEHVEWLRSLTPAAALRLCEDLGRFARRFTYDSAEDQRLGHDRWREKLAIRQRMLSAFVALDRRRE